MKNKKKKGLNSEATRIDLSLFPDTDFGNQGEYTEPRFPERKNIELDIEFDDIKYIGNEELMSHIWINLVGNAIKYTENSGVIIFRAYMTDSEITVKIKDNGIGMNGEVLNKIFDKLLFLIKIKASHTSKDIVTNMNRRSAGWERVFSGKGLVFRACQEHLRINKEKTTCFKKMI